MNYIKIFIRTIIIYLLLVATAVITTEGLGRDEGGNIHYDIKTFIGAYLLT